MLGDGSGRCSFPSNNNKRELNRELFVDSNKVGESFCESERRVVGVTTV